MSTAERARFGEVGARIRDARKTTGLSQERFAPLVGITRRHLIRLENGEHHPSPELRERLAEHTGKSPAHFSLDEDDEEADPMALFADLLSSLDRRYGGTTSNDPAAHLTASTAGSQRNGA